MNTTPSPLTQRHPACRTLALCAAFALLVPAGFVSKAAAQEDPTAIGAGQKPLVIIVVDTSGSMEYGSDKNDTRAFPKYRSRPDGVNPVSMNAPGINPRKSYDTWSPGVLFGNTGDTTKAQFEDRDYEDPGLGPQFVGPCYVWKDQCTTYKRPPWFPKMLGEVSGNSEGTYTNAMLARLNTMRGSYDTGASAYVGSPFTTGIRLQDVDQPRHVQIKEILTGDMILRPRDSSGTSLVTGSLDAKVHGPGCWIVPRMSGAGINRDVSHMCRNVDDASGWFSGHDNAFQNFPDIRDTRPHLQEVFDEQLPTGLLDRMSNTAIFGIAMLDGYNKTTLTHPALTGSYSARGDLVGRQLNDGIPDGNAMGYLPDPEDGIAKYDLGVYKIVTPTRLDLPTSLLTGFSAYAQYALVDAGYQRQYDEGPGQGATPSSNTRHSAYWAIDPEIGAAGPLDYPFPTKLERYVLPYYLGQQPIAKATPLAAAVRDIHSFMIHGQREFQFNGQARATSEVYTPSVDPTADTSYQDLRKMNKDFIVNPVETDRYRQCRPKHVVLMTDGYPDPERPNGPMDTYRNDLGTKPFASGAEAAYGYEDWQNKYVYQRAEREIDSFVTNPHLNDVYSGGNDKGDKFKPRVHVVSLNIEQANTGTGATLESVEANLSEVAKKMGIMAMEGKTCVQHALLQGPEGKRYVPVKMGGTCVPGLPTIDSSGNCLVQQILPGTYSFPVPVMGVTTGPQIDCVAPALMLENDDRGQDDPTFLSAETTGGTRDDMSRVLQLVLNEVLNASGGVASRTRAAVTDRLDTKDQRGQHRIFSGVQVSGGSSYWKGVLERQTLSCKNDFTTLDSPTSRPLEEDIDLQVRRVSPTSTDFVDNRRIFTTVADLDGPSRTLASSGNSRFFVNYRLSSMGFKSADTFRKAVYEGSGNAAYSRVPFFTAALIAAADPDVGSTVPAKLDALLSVNSPERADRVVNEVRGRLFEKQGRILGGILNSNPVTVGPPTEDVAIDSYRAFRRQYANRATMLYVSTLDGLLHAIHTGEHNGGPYNVIRRDFSQVDSTIGQPVVDALAGTQREAWAYMPEMVRRRVDSFIPGNPNLMDGTPVVADVRLCQPSLSANQNEQACRAAEASGVIPGIAQWRTVLVQGLGQAGSGYFAMDVTRSGGRTADGLDVELPDPTLLWEFDPYWEQRQLAQVGSTARRNRFGISTTAPANAFPSISPCSLPSATDITDLPFMGVSVGNAEVGTVVVQDATTTTQRAVAIFGAGQNGETSGPTDCLAADRRGRAIYVVDLQSGTMLRRFLTYKDANGDTYRFQTEITGTPVLSDNRPGVVSNRAFIGDAAGRLFRINMSSPDPEQWGLDLFFDPCTDTDLKTKVGGSCDELKLQDLGHPSVTRPLGPAMFKPAVALMPDRQLAVIYGLGENTDVSSSPDVQAMFALRESFVVTAGIPKSQADVIWMTTFPENTSESYTEKLTGEPIIFNFGVYFTTFIEDKIDPCIPGQSRIWGLNLLGDPNVPKGILGAIELDGSYTTADIVVSGGDPSVAGFFKWYGPVEPVLIRGVALTRRPSCNADPTSGVLSGSPENEEPGVDLIATTGATPVAGDAYNSNQGNPNRADLYSGDAGKLNYSVKRLASPRSTLEPLSWEFIGQ